MDRREMLGVIGIGSAGLLAFTNKASAAGGSHRDKAHQDCMDACTKCAVECESMFNHCNTKTAEGHEKHNKASRLALDCAQFCGLSAMLIARQSPLMSEACEACAQACKKCGDACSKFDSSEMKACAEACQRCEESCREMVKSMRA